MTLRRVLPITLLLLTSGLSPAVANSHMEVAGTKVHSPFGDNMIVQRDAPITFRGSGEAGSKIKLSFAGLSQSVSINGDGQWTASFPPMGASGPFTLEANDEMLAENIHVGDVLLCSGQSNMEYPIRRALNPDRELGAPRHSDLHLLTIPRDSSASPRTHFPDDVTWVPSDSDALEHFSAVCYFTGRALKEDGVAMGLVNSSWGGTRVESWMSAESLSSAGLRLDDLQRLEEFRQDEQAARRAFAEHWEEAWLAANPGQAAPWDETGSLDWTDVPDLVSWKAYGDEALEAYNGQVWYRTQVTLSGGETDFDRIHLGGIDEMDQVWINGTWVGGYFNWGGERDYAIPDDVLKEGVNEIVLNVASGWDKGGLLGPVEAMKLTASDGGEKALTDWAYAKAARQGLDAPTAPWESVTGITGIHNAMIAPLEDLKFKTVLWYQGESNAGDSDPYDPKLTGLFDGWDAVFGAPQDYVVIQLPEFGAFSFSPSESGWARTRDAQRRVAENRARTSLVMTLGAGDPYDIHPANKQEVARRTVETIRSSVDGEATLGALHPKATQMEDGSVRLSFDGPTSVADLAVTDSDQVYGLELCDAEGCAYVSGKFESDAIVLNPDSSKGWTHLRYNWADTPRGNLWLKDRWPVGSFEVEIE